MKKISQLTLILLSALVLSACSLQPNNSDQNNSTSQSDETSTEIEGEAEEFSLRDLIAQNISQKCTWSVEENGNQNTAEILVKGNKFKQTMISNSQEQGKMIIHSISDGQEIYTWTEDNVGNITFAMKMKNDNSPDEVQDSEMASGEINLDEQHQFSCSPTTVSDSDFNPPSDIEFTDYGQFLEDIQSSIPGIPTIESE